MIRRLNDSGFYAQFNVTGGSTRSIYDGSGSSGACGVSGYFYYVLDFRGCEDGVWGDSCTDWVAA